MRKEEAAGGKGLKLLMQKVSANESGQVINGVSLPRPVMTAAVSPNRSLKESLRNSLHNSRVDL